MRHASQHVHKLELYSLNLVIHSVTHSSINVGEREPILLAKEKVKWVLPPGVRATEDVVSDSDGEGGPQGRPVLRGHSSRKWDDDESEVLPMLHPGKQAQSAQGATCA